MIAEALEAAWMVVGVAAVAVGLYAVVVAGWGIWRMLRAAWGAMGSRSDSLPPLAAPERSGDHIPARPASRPSGPP